MGTRADFYVGRGKSAEWLGSIAWDGYEWAGNPCGSFAEAADIETYRESVSDLLAERSDATTPDMGWPWPWDNSQTTDYSYSFDDGRVYYSVFGHCWRPVGDISDDDEMDGDKVEFPDMSDQKAMTLGPRSGLIVIGG